MLDFENPVAILYSVYDATPANSGYSDPKKGHLRDSWCLASCYAPSALLRCATFAGNASPPPYFAKEPRLSNCPLIAQAAICKNTSLRIVLLRSDQRRTNVGVSSAAQPRNVEELRTSIAWDKDEAAPMMS